MLAQVFNHFLNLTEREAATVRGFSGVLAEGGEEFARAFYAYLNRHPATAALLERYQAVGGAIDDLVGKQLDHFERFLNAELGEAYATELIRVGEVHFEWRVEPPWIVGGYWLYSEHLTARARRDPRIPHDRRAPLIGAIERLILRDIGLMLEGYWQAALAEQEAHLERIEALQEHLSAILSNIPQLLWSVDPEQNELLYISPSHRVICEIDAELPIPCLNWTVPEDRERVVEAWRRAVGGMPVSLESRIHAPDGDARWFRRQFRPSLSEQGRVQRIDGIMEDISEEVKTRIELEALATTDALTGLYNRSVWYTRLEAMTSRAAGRIEHFPVMILDLNEFKRINDVLGHPVGDALLAKLGARL
ncbi:MAG: diguanylate cyclase, partial [Gammaproteobacteria bacterium]|nr:diguanylate cyclase [Gammaproteobacteria bacterium]